MKSFLTTLLAIACAVILIWGNVHWKQKSIVSESSEPVSNESITTKGTASNKNEKPISQDENFSPFIRNWPKEAKTVFTRALEEKRPFKLLIVGSGAVGEENAGWAYSVKKELERFYGDDVITVNIEEYNETTMTFIQENGPAILAEEGADMILFEPFTLTDNGIVLIEDSLTNILSIIDTVKETNPETAFILQPPNPIYQPKLYATQIEELEVFAAENNIPYLDHWEAWPDTQSDEINEYLEDETGQPNEEGHKIWSQYVIDYFISK